MFEDLVKAVVGIEKQVMVVDADMHADQEFFYLKTNLNKNIYGALIYFQIIMELTSLLYSIL